MAVYKRDMVDINLETGNIHRSFLQHSIGFKDQQADHFGIRAFRNGEPVNLTGVSIQGIFMPPQGSPIAITSGNIVNYNEAEVVLPQACYNYNGQFTLAIKLVDPSNSVTGTIRIIDGMVDNTNASGTVAPVAAIPSYQEVLSTYEQAIAAINKTVRFDAIQSLTDTQKATARGNISAPSVADLQAEAAAREAADTAEAATRAAADADLKSALDANMILTENVSTNLSVKYALDLQVGDDCVLTTSDGSNFASGSVFNLYNDAGERVAYYTISGGSSPRTITYNPSSGKNAKWFSITGAASTQTIHVINTSRKSLIATQPRIDEVDAKIEKFWFTYYYALMTTNTGGPANAVLFYAKPGDSVTFRSKDGTTITPSYISFRDKSKTEITGYQMTGYGSSRTVTLSSELTSDIYYVSMSGGTAQDIEVVNNSSVLDVDGVKKDLLSFEDFTYRTFGLAVFYNQTAADRVKVFLPIQKNDVLIIETLDGSNFTPTNLELYGEDSSTQTSYYGLSATGSNKRTVTYDNDTPSFYMKTSGGTAQAIMVTIKNKKERFISAITATEVIRNSSLPANWTSRLNQIQKAQGQKFTFAVQTDTHMTGEEDDTYVYPLKNLSNRMGFDFICNLGDINKGYQTDSTSANETAITNIMHRYVDDLQCPMLFALGNHEDGSLYTGDAGTGNYSLDECLLLPELYAKIMKLVNNTEDIISPKKDFYYYVDFNDVRVIVLNTHDVDWETLGTPLGVSVNSHVISDAQLAWFVNVALNTQKPVIIMCHVPLVSELSENLPTNAADIVTAINSFKSNGGTVVGVFCGHTHKQDSHYDETNGIPYIVFANGGNFAEIVMVDIENKTITTKMVGNYGSKTDRSFTYT